MERRQPGRRKIEYQGANGDTHILYETRQTALERGLRILGGGIGVVGLVYAVATYVVINQATSTIREEIKKPNGIIYSATHACVDDHIQPVQKDLNALMTNAAVQTQQMEDVKEDVQDVKKDLRDIKKDIQTIARNGNNDG